MLAGVAVGRYAIAVARVNCWTAGTLIPRRSIDYHSVALSVVALSHLLDSVQVVLGYTA